MTDLHQRPSDATEGTRTGLRLGCLVAPLAQQLAAFEFDAGVMGHFQRDMEAISRVLIRGLIPYSAAMKAYDKLAKKIVAHVDAKTLKAKASNTGVGG